MEPANNKIGKQIPLCGVPSHRDGGMYMYKMAFFNLSVNASLKCLNQWLNLKKGFSERVKCPLEIENYFLTFIIEGHILSLYFTISYLIKMIIL